MEIMSDEKLKIDNRVPSAVNRQLKKGYKQTDVGVISVDWDVIELGSLIGKLEAGVSVNSIEDELESHDFYILKTSAIFNGRFKSSERKKILSSDLFRAKLSPKGKTIIISRMNTPELVGECGYVEKDYQDLFLPDRLWMVTVYNKNKLDMRWLSYLLTSYHFKKIIKNSATGTSGSMKNISKGSFLSIQIPLPQLYEQQSISEALGDVDSLINTLDILITKKCNIKQGAMQQLLTGKKRLPGFTENWEIKKIIDISPLQRGFDLPTTLLKKGTFPVVYSNGILNYHINYKVKAPGVVTGRSGTIGKVTFVKYDYWPHNTSLWVTDYKGNDPKFIYYIFTFINLEKFSTGSGVPTLNRNDIHALKIPLSPLREQQVIAEVLSDMDDEINRLEQQLNKTKLIKQGMMQELLTGKTRLL